MYHPEIKPNLHQTKEEYKKSNGTTINHFYEKLFLLSDKMNTDYGYEEAKRRETFMREFLEEFFLELQFFRYHARVLLGRYLFESLHLSLKHGLFSCYKGRLF